MSPRKLPPRDEKGKFRKASPTVKVISLEDRLRALSTLQITVLVVIVLSFAIASAAAFYFLFGHAADEKRGEGVALHGREVHRQGDCKQGCCGHGCGDRLTQQQVVVVNNYFMYPDFPAKDIDGHDDDEL